MEQLITCINCPVGCRMQVTVKNNEVTSVSGNSCKLGLNYAKQECIAPKRMVTAVVKVKDRILPLSVKTREPIPKSKIFDVMKELGKLNMSAPICIGQVICENICDTGVSIIATKSVE
ncbi:MAG: DUF1667 domain-containing protein [Clostridiales bacterium]|nr:DUF1667 domain-containing protein [Clostridiales bacterium]